MAATALWGCGRASVVLVAASLALSIAGSVLHWHVLAAPGASRLGLLAVLALTAAIVPWLTHSIAASAADSCRSVLVASSPGLALVATVLLSLWWPLSERAGWFFGGDHVRHLVYVVQLRTDGALDYSTNEYPRAWHAAIALVWSASGQPAGTPSADGVLHLISLMSTAVWLLHALLTVNVGQLGMALARRVGLSPRAAGFAGFTAGCLSLWPAFLGNYQILGFENSILAAVLLSTGAREILERPSSLRALATTAAIAGVMAHVWQLLLPVAVVAFLVSGVAVRRRDPRLIGYVVGAFAVSMAVAWPGVSAAVNRVGLEQAANASVPSPVPLTLLSMSVVALGILVVKRRQDHRVLAYAGLIGVTTVGAFALAARLSIPVLQYYPSKMLWTAAVLSLASLGVAIQQVAEALWSRAGRPAAVIRPTLAAVCLLLVAYSAAGPLFPVLGPSATADGATTLGALRAPAAASAEVVWLPRATGEETRFNSTTVRLMLEVFEARRGMRSRDQRSPTVAQECELLRQSSQPTVLSTASTEAVRTRYECVPGVAVIPVQLFDG